MSIISLLKGKTDEFTEMPLEEALKWIYKISGHLANEIYFLKEFLGEHTEEISELLSEDTIARFKSVAYSLQFPFLSYSKSSDDDKKLLEQGLLVQSWSALGALLESTLQLFLAFHYRDYIQSEWSKWNTEAIEQISTLLSGNLKPSLESLVHQNEQNGVIGLTNEIKKSFIRKATDILKEKRKLPKLERITLSDLIDFYESQNVLLKGDYEKEDLQKIRDYRNSIHTFQKRTIGSWDELNEYGKVLLQMTIDMLYQLPEIPSEVPIPEWYYDDKSEIIMQANNWFNYRVQLDI
mgnify:CR=1 FL=1